MDCQAPQSCCMNLSLTNDLLVDIFCRLPSVESVVKCKCVCKQWFSLIAQPDFAARFIEHKINGESKSKNKNREEDEELLPFAFYIEGRNQDAFIYTSSPAFSSIDFSLSFMPSYGRRGECNFMVKACCNDLILCSSLLELDLYVCNPRTMQWFQLPAPSQKDRFSLAGLVCDPYYVFDKESGTITLSTSCQYSVYYVLPCPEPKNILEMEIFSSVTGVWKKAFLLLPNYGMKFFTRYFKSCFTYNRMVHFFTQDIIIGFDPYKTSKESLFRCHTIQLPPRDAYSLCHMEYVGVSGQKLFLVRSYESIIPQQPLTTVYSLKVWELKNYETGEWSVKRMVHLHDLILQNFSKFEDISRTNGCQFLIIHQNDADIVLLRMREHIVECNLREKTCTLLRCISMRACYGLVFPLWPSPLLQCV